MPTIELSGKRFEDLMGREVSKEEVREELPMMGVEVEIQETKTEVEAFPNRPDLLSPEGLVRYYKGFKGEEKGLKKYPSKKTDKSILVNENVKSRRPYILNAIIKDVNLTEKVLEDLIQLQEKLHVTHGRERRKAAIGLYDLDKIEFPVMYKAYEPDQIQYIPLEETEKLDLGEVLEKHGKGKKYGSVIEDFNKYPVLMDATDRVLALIPIINSKETQVTSETKDLFIDVTGTDFKVVEKALNIIVTAILENGGELHEVEMDYPYKKENPGKQFKSPLFEQQEFSLKASYVNDYLGVDLSPGEITSYLEKARFGVEVNDEIEVTIPCYRTDMISKFDLVEEVAIQYGYDEFKPEIPNITTEAEEADIERIRQKIRNIMSNIGLVEVMNFTLTNKENLFEKMRREEKEVVKVEESRTGGMEILRDMILPSLIENLKNNTHNPYPQKIFEVEEVVKREKNPVKSKKETHLGAVIAKPDASFSKAESILKTLIERLGLDYEFEEIKKPFTIDGRTGRIVVANQEVGFIGEIHPKVLRNWELEMPVAGFEINLEKIKDIVL